MYKTAHSVKIPSIQNNTMRTRALRLAFFVLGAILLLPALSQAQSQIALQADTGNWMARCDGCQNTVDPSNTNTATLHVTDPTPPYARFQLVDVGGGKIALKADNGNWVARCRGCIVGGRTDDFVTMHVPGTLPPPAYAQFTPVLLSNGKYALRADTGLYVSRCESCSPGATTRDQVTIHVPDPNTAPYAQWTIIPILRGT